MDELTKQAEELERLVSDVSKPHEHLQVASGALSTATATGKGDVVDLSLKAAKASQVYNEARKRAVESLQFARKRFRTEARAARKRGVPFSKHVAERSLPAEPEEYSAVFLLESVEELKAGIQSLIPAVEEFDTFQEQIANTLSEMRREQERLERLHAHGRVDAEEMDTLEQRFNDPSERREPLLHDAQKLLASWRTEAWNVLESQICEVYDTFETLLSQLDALGTKSAEDDSVLESLRTRGDALSDLEGGPSIDSLESCESLLEDLHKFVGRYQEKVEESRHELNLRIGEAAEQAKGLIKQMHAEMPEALRLRDLLGQQGALEEPQLVPYLCQLEKCVAEAGAAGPRTLERYEELVSIDKGYLFSEEREIEQVGFALLVAATLPEEYSGRLWSIGEDVLLRIMLTDFSAKDFYDRFGYPAITRALHAASESGDLVQALSFLDSEFLPPEGDSPEDPIRTLLGYASIREVLQKAAETDCLRMDVHQFSRLKAVHHRALLALLEHADILTVPNQVKLQWAALLYDVFPRDHELHCRVCHLFLMALMQAGQYVSLYYSLEALGMQHPELWNSVGLRPMLQCAVAKVLDLGSSGRRILVNMAGSSALTQIAADDFGSEFLLASLSHYAAVRWGHTALLNRAWAVWDQLKREYPVFAEALIRQLQGDRFDVGATMDTEVLKQEFEHLSGRLTMRFKPSGYRGMRLPVMIQRWYVSEYMQGWLDQIRSKELSAEDITELRVQVAELQESEDLVEACPLQHNPPRSNVQLEPLEGRYKDNVNNRLLDILELFQEIIQVRWQLLPESRAHAIPRDALAKELGQICERSSVAAWSIRHLLQPRLPFIEDCLSGWCRTAEDAG